MSIQLEFLRDRLRDLQLYATAYSREGFGPEGRLDQLRGAAKAVAGAIWAIANAQLNEGCYSWPTLSKAWDEACKLEERLQKGVFTEPFHDSTLFQANLSEGPGVSAWVLALHEGSTEDQEVKRALETLAYLARYCQVVAAVN
jgi:hypothetical protein